MTKPISPTLRNIFIDWLTQDCRVMVDSAMSDETLIRLMHEHYPGGLNELRKDVREIIDTQPAGKGS